FPARVDVPDDQGARLEVILALERQGLLRGVAVVVLAAHLGGEGRRALDEAHRVGREQAAIEGDDRAEGAPPHTEVRDRVSERGGPYLPLPRRSLVFAQRGQ